MAKETLEATVRVFISSSIPRLAFATAFLAHTVSQRSYFSTLFRSRSLLWLQRQQRTIVEVVKDTKQSVLYGREGEQTRQIFEDNGGMMSNCCRVLRDRR